jgi:hypothetical protein
LSLRDWFRDGGPWWGPYLGVLLFAAAAGVLVLLILLANAEELLRVLRASSGSGAG